MDTISLLWASIEDNIVGHIGIDRTWEKYLPFLIDAYLDAGDQDTHDFLRELRESGHRPYWLDLGWLVKPEPFSISGAKLDSEVYFAVDRETFLRYFTTLGKAKPVGLDVAIYAARYSVEKAALARKALVG